MNIGEYEKESARTESPMYHSSAVKPETFHGVLGIGTESGELLDAVKKAFFYGLPLNLVNIREEIGDVMWYVMAVIRSEGWDLEEIMQENIDKLRIRYPEQFSSEHAVKRLDKE